MIEIYDAIVIGAGAAGMMTAIEAAKTDKKILVLEHNKEIGNKILISGGGRCNFTNINAKPENYISDNPNFIRSSFSRYTPQDFIDLVQHYNIDYYEKKLGQLFCKNSSRQIINMLLEEAVINKVEVLTEIKVNSISKNKDELFQISTNKGEYKCFNVVIATGGLSFPKKGATSFGYQIAKDYGHSIIETKPGLVPITLDDSYSSLKDLSGISIDSKVTVNNISFRENILFTHRGMSGPAILQISSYMNDNEIIIDIMPNNDALEWINSIKNNNKDLKTSINELFPSRFAEYIMSLLPEKKIQNYSKEEFEQLYKMIKVWRVNADGTEGYIKAEVTLGGVNTKELNQKSMESKLNEGLYFVGEVVDITGWLGGYNFQWAWASGYCAGQDIANK